MIDAHFLTAIVLVVASAFLWYSTKGHPWHGKIMLVVVFLVILTMAGVYKQTGPSEDRARLHNDQRYHAEQRKAAPLPERVTKQDTAREDFLESLSTD